MVVDGISYHEFEGKGVTIMMCSCCNVKCKHCYIGYKGNFDPKELYKFTRHLKKKYHIYLNGTEPLLIEKYLKVFKLVKQRNCLTNGLVLKNDKNMIKKLLKNKIKFIGISYHFQFHDQISSIPRETIIEVAKKAVENGINVTLNCTVSKQNYLHVLDNCKEAVEIGVPRIRFTNLINAGEASNNCFDNVLNDEERKEFFRLLEIARNTYSEDVLQIQRCGTFDRDIHRGKDNFYCSSIENFVVIAPDYYVYPCIFQTAEKDRIGFVKDGKVYIRDGLNYNPQRCTTFLNKNTKEGFKR